ncbi:hypothetical protein B0T22DRAFT_435553 [Podospora appendiculata]|uniref:Uncharacterized protein n=1 Tax=Podospora appendiculata TaxID=314037 RepID=A0AAE0XEZ1_9PEZI|nr:hypothetical protein B0T22DRAFT_435553 [Podospora appendiculata]
MDESLLPLLEWRSTRRITLLAKRVAILADAIGEQLGKHGVFNSDINAPRQSRAEQVMDRHVRLEVRISSPAAQAGGAKRAADGGELLASTIVSQLKVWSNLGQCGEQVMYYVQCQFQRNVPAQGGRRGTGNKPERTIGPLFGNVMTYCSNIFLIMLLVLGAPGRAKVTSDGR